MHNSFEQAQDAKKSGATLQMLHLYPTGHPGLPQ
jgi:hypothetical protein